MKHKNLVFIFSDQQRYDTMACYGNDWIKTPNLNSLSDESFVMERNCPHKLIAQDGPVKFVEISTFHEDSDSYRVYK